MSTHGVRAVRRQPLWRAAVASVGAASGAALPARRGASVLAVVALVAAMLTYTSLPSVAPQASAATAVGIGTIRAQISDQHGTNSSYTSTNDTNACLRYGPTNNGGSATTGPTDWVTYGTEAQAGHGYDSSCNSWSKTNKVSTDDQSVVAINPSNVTSAPADASPFLLATVKHYNNPISSSSPSYYKGNLKLQLGSFSGKTLSIPWTLWETPNGDSPCANPSGPNSAGCADKIAFSSDISDQTVTDSQGHTYRLVIKGFYSGTVTKNGTVTCDSGAQPQAAFWTKEGGVTGACLYASLSQVRSLTIVKKVVGKTTGTRFSFGSTSDLNGSPWDGTSFNLTASQGASASYGPQELLQGESVTVTETKQSDSRWALTDIACVDGSGASLTTGVTADRPSGTLSIDDTPAPATAAQADITCTFTNTYTPTAYLTLDKTVQGGPTDASHWTLTAQSTTDPSAIFSGPGKGTGQVSDQQVPAGTYTLSETPTGSDTAGYLQDGPWKCGGTNLGTDNQVTLQDGQHVTCHVQNRYQTGSLTITKTVTDPAGGYTGTTKQFTGTYTCTAAGTTVASGTFALANGGSTTIDSIPAGAVCTVAETPPTGGLKDGSYHWGAISYSPDGGRTTITDKGTATVAITNTVVRDTGSLVIAKAIQPRDGTDANGYAGGATRTFPITYSCVIGSARVAGGTVHPSTGSPVTVPGIPATAKCSVTGEDESAQSGDFPDTSYSWDGNDLGDTVTIGTSSAQTVTVTNYFKRSYVDLTIKKVVDGDGYTGGNGKNFTVDITGCSATPSTVTLADDGSATVTVAANTVCTVSERTPSGHLAAAYQWSAPTYGPNADGTITVAPGHRGTVTVTNHTQQIFGAIRITKKVTGDTDGLVAGTAFPITADCDNGHSYPLQVQAGAENAATIEHLPVGTRCSVTEDAPTGSHGLTNPSYVWGDAPAAQTVTVGAKDQVVDVTVTNTIDRAYGSLAIVKKVVGKDGLDGSGITFSGTWTCSYGGDSVTGTWSTTGAGSDLVSDHILLTSSCTATEDDPAGPPSTTDSSYRWGARSITGPVTVLGRDPATITVTNPIVRVTGSLAISKTVTGATAGVGYAADARFPFHYSCSPQGGGTAITGDVTVTAGGTITIDADIPAGSDCTVTEGDNPAPIDPYRWEGVTLTAAGATGSQDGRAITFSTPADGAAVTVSADNAIGAKTASVSVTKHVDGPTAGLASGSTFPITLVCAAGRSTTSYGPRDVADGGTVTFDGIPLGSTCTASEGDRPALVDGSYVWDGQPSYAPADGVTLETAGETAGPIVVTNTITRVYGQLALTKVITANDNAGVAEGRTFTGSWSCSYGGGDPVTGGWTVDGSGPATLTGIPANGILVGSTCSATESGPAPIAGDGSYRWDEPVYADATVQATGTATMTVTNTLLRDTGSLTVQKKMTGETAGYTGRGAQFTIGYRCYLSDPSVGPFYQDEITVTPGAAPVALATGIPVGWTCSVSEATPSDSLLVDGSYRWETPDITIDGADTRTVTVGSTSAAVVVTNSISRVTGTFGITKAIAAAVPSGVIDDGTTYTGSYACTYGGTPKATFSGTWSVNGAGAATLTPAAGQGLRFPLGTSCSATENEPVQGDLVDVSWAWNTPRVSADVTIAGTQDVPTITVTNSVHRVYAGLTVTKKYGGVTGALPSGAEVSGSWSCSYDGVVQDSGSWTLPASGGSTVLVSGADGTVPATSRCTVTENTLDDADLTDASYTWNAPVYSPSGGAVTAAAGDDNSVTVTNSTQRVYGNLTITKIVDGPADQGITFSGEYSCTYPGQPAVTGTWSTQADQDVTIGNILVGSACSITGEDPADGPVAADPSYQWQGYSVDPASVTVAGATSQVQAALTITNTVQRYTGSFSITKQLADGSQIPPAGQTFTFDWTCTPLTGDQLSGTSDAISIGQTWSNPVEIPGGSTCVVTENAPSVPAHQAWKAPVFSVSGVGENGGTPADGGISFVLPGSSEQVPVVVTATNDLYTPSWTLSKTSDPASGSTVQPGATIEYTLTATNTSDTVISGATATDTLPTNATVVEDANALAAQGLSLSADGTALQWSIGDIAVNGKQTASYHVTVATDAYGQTVRNSVTPDTPGGSCTTQAGESCTTDNPIPAWTLAKSSDPASGSTVHPGQTITYTLTATNTSQASVEGATATDTLPAGVALVTPLPEGLTDNGDGTLTWAVPDMPAGSAPVTVTYRVTVSTAAVGTLTNTVAPGTPGGSCASDADCTTTHRVPAVPQLAISKTASERFVSGGQVFTYTIAVSNVSGLGSADPVHLSDPIPTELAVTGIATSDAASPRWQGCSVTGADSSGFGGTLTCDLSGPLAPGAQAPDVVLTVRVMDGAVAGDIVNTATVSWKNPDDPGTPARSVKDSATVSVIQVLPTSSSDPAPPTSSSDPTPPTSSSDPTPRDSSSTPTSPSSSAPITVLPTSSTMAYTGVDTIGMGWLAFLLLGGGALLLVVGTAWRRKPRRH